MQLVLIKNLRYDYTTVRELKDSNNLSSEYVVLSHPAEVEFVEFSHEEVVNQEIGQLRKVKKDLQAETERKINEIDNKIQNLMALPAPE